MHRIVLYSIIHHVEELSAPPVLGRLTMYIYVGSHNVIPFGKTRAPRSRLLHPAAPPSRAAAPWHESRSQRSRWPPASAPKTRDSPLGPHHQRHQQGCPHGRVGLCSSQIPVLVDCLVPSVDPCSTRTIRGFSGVGGWTHRSQVAEGGGVGRVGAGVVGGILNAFFGGELAIVLLFSQL